MTRRAVVIGSGFGGLALAIRLQSAGIETVVLEARDRPGGRAYAWERDGHVFDAGPTVVTDPACLRELWALSGAEMADDVTLARKKALRRGHQLLDTLDDVKADLLFGRVSEGKLNQLLALLGQAREQTSPGLDSALADVELRARVELAKFGRYAAA